MKGIIFKFQAVTFLLINPNLQQDNDGPAQITAVITLWCLNHSQHDSLPMSRARAANNPSVYTIMEKAPTMASSWLKAPTI